MNNEPVAWIDPYDLERLPLYDCWVNGEKSKGSIPLYTHSVKELTDEEIIETVKYHFIGAIKVGIVLTNDNVLEFARAILRKARE